MVALEEELRDGEVGPGQLGRELAAVLGPAGRLGVAFGVRGDTNAERTGGPDVFDQLGAYR